LKIIKKKKKKNMRKKMNYKQYSLEKLQNTLDNKQNSEELNNIIGVRVDKQNYYLMIMMRQIMSTLKKKYINK